MKDKIIIYTDGAARGNPGPSGWGVLIKIGKKEIELGGRENHATNNQMELTATIRALKFLSSFPISDIGKSEIIIYADSKYVILGITEWIDNWLKNNWRTANKKPVLNKELWQELYNLTLEFKIKWNYVKGHSGDIHNDRVDEIATSFADKIDIKLKN